MSAFVSDSPMTDLCGSVTVRRAAIVASSSLRCTTGVGNSGVVTIADIMEMAAAWTNTVKIAIVRSSPMRASSSSSAAEMAGVDPMRAQMILY